MAGFGKYNLSTNQALLVVGNGTSSTARADAFVVTSTKTNVFGAPIEKGCVRNIFIAPSNANLSSTTWSNAGKVGDILFVLSDNLPPADEPDVWEPDYDPGTNDNEEN